MHTNNSVNSILVGGGGGNYGYSSNGVGGVNNTG
jgi:hypothetical protein